MGKYNSNTTLKPSSIQSKSMHEIWRGIGCLMFLIIPAISIAAGYETVRYGLENKWPIPYELLGTVYLPDIFYSTSGLSTIFSPISKVPNIFAITVASLIYMMLIGGVISVIYAATYRMIGPSRYGPTDAPPSGIKVKKYKR